VANTTIILIILAKIVWLAIMVARPILSWKMPSVLALAWQGITVLPEVQLPQHNNAPLVDMELCNKQQIPAQVPVPRAILAMQ
jgi:hypothetical protein